MAHKRHPALYVEVASLFTAAKDLGGKNAISPGVTPLIDSVNCLWPLADCDFLRGSPRVIATLSQRDFYELQLRAPEFTRWRDYKDFRIERDSDFLCGCSAGLPVRQQRVPLRLFRAWSRLTGAPITLAGLDDFALRWRMRRTHPEIVLVGALIEDGVPAVALVSGGGLVVPIARRSFEAWARALSSLPGVTTGATFDHYVDLAAEACLPAPLKGVLR